MSDVPEFLPPISSDLTEAALWYDEQEPSPGDRFLDGFRLAVREVMQSPASPRKFYLEFRKMPFATFLYFLCIRVYEEKVVIILVVHSARHPDRIKRLLRKRLPGQ